MLNYLQVYYYRYAFHAVSFPCIVYSQCHIIYLLVVNLLWTLTTGGIFTNLEVMANDRKNEDEEKSENSTHKKIVPSAVEKQLIESVNSG
jgi:hypothetical protein